MTAASAAPLSKQLLQLLSLLLTFRGLSAGPSCTGECPGFLLAALTQTSERMSQKYNMSLSLTYHSPELTLTTAAGYIDAGLKMGRATQKARPDDLYVWGSTTKMFTAPAILQLVEKGAVSLSDPVSTHVDPLLMKWNGTRLEDRFGSAIHRVTIKHLLHMMSGLGDYDGEDFARDQFANRTKAFGPLEIVGRYVPTDLQFEPGTKQAYCSSNYIMLGLVLAAHSDIKSWKDLDQLKVVPPKLRGEFNHSIFMNDGPCEDFTPVHGFMESYSTAALPSQDIWNLSCAGGWTAGNYLGTTEDVARFTYDLYNLRTPMIVSKKSQALLTDFSTTADAENGFKFYGMGTFSLDWSIGDGEAYGHVGDTYGYQSQTTYFPGLDFVLAVATNVETATQAQPADTICTAYHEVISVLQGVKAPSCNFHVFGRFIGICRCSSESAELESLVI